MILTTSLAEIYSYRPCAGGWKAILSAHPHSTEEDLNAQFPLIDCLNSNSIADVCWLIGQRKVEISICVKFARMCADSVKHLNNRHADNAAAAADNAAIYAAANDADAYADAAVNAAATVNAAAAIAAVNAAATAAADAINAAVNAVNAADAADAAYKEQKSKNKQFLIKCINNYSAAQ